MKKAIKKTLAVFLTLVMLVGFVPFSKNLFENTTLDVKAANGVYNRIQEILAVYPSGSYFTTDGAYYESSSGEKCSLANIPSRGGLSTGSEAANVCGPGSSCNAFAKYVYYNIFHNAVYSQPTINDLSQLSVGDFVVFEGHYGIFLSYDSNYVYVYDSNFTNPPSNIVKYNSRIPRSRFDYAYHASNYDEVNGSSTDLSTDPNSTTDPNPDSNSTPEDEHVLIQLDSPVGRYEGRNNIELKGWVACDVEPSYIMAEVTTQYNMQFYDNTANESVEGYKYLFRFSTVINIYHLRNYQTYTVKIWSQHNEKITYYESSFETGDINIPPRDPIPTRGNLVYLDTPIGTYGGRDHIELKGWIASNTNPAYIMSEVVGTNVQYDMQFYDNVQYEQWPGYNHLYRFSTVIDINLLSSNRTYQVNVWSDITDAVCFYFETGYIDPKQYFVSFAGNNCSNLPSPIIVNEGTFATIPSTIPQKTGYTFKGWSTSPSSNNVNYKVGDSLTVSTNVVLYGVFEVNKYSVTYNANGGTDSPSAQIKTHDIALTLSTLRPTREGYTFLGWSTNSADTSATYQPGCSFDLNVDTTLYAIWEEIPVEESSEEASEEESSEEASEIIDPDLPTIVVESKTARKGDTFDVSIDLKNNAGIASAKFEVYYDDNKFELTDIVFNAELGGTFMTSPSLESPAIINWYSLTNIEGDVNFAILKFKAKDDISEGKYYIKVKYNEEDVFDADENNVYFQVQNSSIEIIDYIPGDITGDGFVNNKDLSRLHKHLTGWDVEVIESALDVNGDGNINNKDLMHLMKYLSNYDVVLY